MKKLTVILAAVFGLGIAAHAKEKKIDWSLCEQEIAAHCAKATSDHGKHECIEKLPKEKVSKDCRKKNEKLEGSFGKHKHDHK